MYVRFFAFVGTKTMIHKVNLMIVDRKLFH